MPDGINCLRDYVYEHICFVLMDIAAFRKAHGLSQAALADKLGINQATVSRLETGKMRVNRRTVLALEAISLQARA